MALDRNATKQATLYAFDADSPALSARTLYNHQGPARALFDIPQTPDIVEALAGYDLLFFSGITLSLYGAAGRARFFDALDRAQARGARIAFDANFRPRGWPDGPVAHAAYEQAFDRADIVLASTEDLRLLFGGDNPTERLLVYSSAERVLKLPDLACRIVMADGLDQVVAAKPVARVVDTTAAGDSFAAAYLASRLAGADPVTAAEAGHTLAGVVVSHPGAIIPRSAMPGFLQPSDGFFGRTQA